MGLKRREFLQKASWAIAALGISETGWWQLQHRSLAALAEPTGRKLALLVGINQYPETALSGCVTDVEMQRELLIHRFGFQPSDILTLTDKQATRQKIETAFIEHLSNQAKPDDVVVFHFSGYGSRVSKTLTQEEEVDSVEAKSIVQNSLVPVDGKVNTSTGIVVNEILAETLWLLLQSVPTNKVVTVLDTCYIYPGKNLQGFLRVRSLPSRTTEQLNVEAQAIQETLRSRINLSLNQPIDGTQLPGVILSATENSLFATEAPWSGFSSGLFTYALTQNLWLATSGTKLQFIFDRAAGFIEQIAGSYQQPEYQNKQTERKLLDLISFSSPSEILLPNSPPAHGSIASLEDSGKTANIKLGGLPPNVLELLQVNSLFTIVSPTDSGNTLTPYLQIRSRTGLTAKATVIVSGTQQQQSQTATNGNSQPDNPNSSSLVGQLVREKIRILPKLINLNVSLGQTLTRIERVDATSGFSAIPQVSVVSGEQVADYIFSRVQETTIAQGASAPLPSIYQGRYALFSAGQVLVPETLGEGGEAVKVATQRLAPELNILLANKIIGLSTNEESSALKVRAKLATTETEATEIKVVMQRETLGVVNIDKNETETNGVKNVDAAKGLLSLAVDTQVQYELHNYGDRPVYFMLFGVDTNGRVLVLDPMFTNATWKNAPLIQDGMIIPPGESVNVPPVLSGSAIGKTSFPWKLIGPEGLVRTQIIFSQAPFKETNALLKGEMIPIRDNYPIKKLLIPLKIAQAVLQDLQNASKSAIEKAGMSTDNWTLDIDSWASFDFIYRVV